jgi:hypothetical protein
MATWSKARTVFARSIIIVIIINAKSRVVETLTVAKQIKPYETISFFTVSQRHPN